jgi:hypothetical protein
MPRQLRLTWRWLPQLQRRWSQKRLGEMPFGLTTGTVNMSSVNVYACVHVPTIHLMDLALCVPALLCAAHVGLS